LVNSQQDPLLCYWFLGENAPKWDRLYLVGVWVTDHDLSRCSSRIPSQDLSRSSPPSRSSPSGPRRQGSASPRPFGAPLTAPGRFGASSSKGKAARLVPAANMTPAGGKIAVRYTMRLKFQADADLDARVLRALKRAAPEMNCRRAWQGSTEPGSPHDARPLQPIRNPGGKSRCDSAS